MAAKLDPPRDARITFDLKSDERTVWLRFDPPLTGRNRRLTITGKSQVPDGGRVEAPRVRVKNAAWLDGSLAVQSNGVRLSQWDLRDVRRATSTRMAVDGRSDWSLASPESGVSFIVERLPVGLSAQTGSTVRIDVEAATATVVTDFTAASASEFELAADVAPGWIIDSLETVPTQALDDWELTPTEAGQSLRVSLQRSVSPDQNVRVLIEAHRPPPVPSEDLTGDQLRPIRWLTTKSQGYLALAIDALWQMDFRGSERPRQVDPELLTSAETDRLEISDDVVLFADDELFNAGRLELAPESPRFSAAWQLRIAGDANQIEQEARLRIEPTLSPVERLHVLVRPSVGKQLQWQLLGDDTGVLQAELVRDGDASGEDEWELTLGRARRSPFSLVARLSQKPSPHLSGCFFRCVEAAVQTGVVELSRSPRTRLVIERTAGLQRLWSEADEQNLSRWRFDPTHAAALVLRSAGVNELGQLLRVDQVTLRTRLAENHVIHEASYRIVNRQQQDFSVTLPRDSEVDQVLLQGRPVDAKPSAAGQTLRISVPKSSVPLEVRVAYKVHLTPRGATFLLPAAWPECSAPAALRTWQVTYPQRYRQLSSASSDGWSWGTLWERLRAPFPGFDSSEPPTEPRAAPGCTELEFHNTENLPASLRLIHEDAVNGLGWVALALCWMSVGFHRRGPLHLAWLIGSLGMVALLLPSAFDPIPHRVMLGLVAGLISREWLQASADFRSPAPRPNALRQAIATAMLTILLPSLTWDDPAASVSAQERAKKDVIHRVVFPVDDDGKPTDDYVYTSETFFKELFRRARQSTVSGPTALLVAGEYRARPRADALSWESIEATLAVEALQPGTVQIPWPREGFVVPAERFRLDGRTAPVTWNTEGTALSLMVDAAGPHTIQFSAQPTRGDDGQMLELRLPPASANRMVLDTLDEAARLQVLPGPLAIEIADENGLLHVDLGQRSEITLLTQPLLEADAKVNAEQLIWTNLWRGGSVVEGRWRFKAAGGILSEAAIEVAGEMELISAAALTPASVQWQPDKENSRLLWTPRAPTDELVVEAVFLQRHPGEERVLPRIEPLNATVTKRWLAIDLQDDSGLAPEPIPAADKIDVAEFAALWNAEDLPRTARSLPQSGPVPLASLPKEAELAYEAMTRAEIGTQMTRYEFRAELKEQGGAHDILRVAMTPGASVESVELGVAGQLRSLPWLTLAGGELALLPLEAIKGGQVIVVRGSLPNAQGERSFMPPVLRDAQATSHVIELVRRNDVQMRLGSHPGFSQTSAPVAKTDGTTPAARLELDEQPPAGERRLHWTVEPNHPRTVGILVTTLRHEGTRWVARLDVFLAVRDGTVDAFRLEAPADWYPLRIVEGEATLSSQPPSGGLRLLELVPRDLAQTRFHFACESTFIGGQQIDVPVFRLLDAENTQQYLRLPEGPDQQWSTSGVQPAALPAAATLADDPELVVYRAAVPHFHVSLRTPLATPSPHIAWGDVVVSRREGNSYIAVASLTLDPSQESALDFRLPDHALLVQAEVEGDAAIVEIHGQRRFRLPLHSSTLPQMVRLLYTGPYQPDADLAPRMDSWKLDQPLTIRAPEVSPAGPALSDLARLLATAMPERSPAEGPIAGWANRWLPRIMEARTLAARSNDEAADLIQADELISRLRALSDAEAPPAGDPLRDYVNLLAKPPNDVRPVPGHATWLFTLVGWVGVVAGGYQASRSPRLQEFSRRWPSACGVLTGLAMALLVSPWVGGVLMAIAAASALAWPWQRAAR